MIGALSALLFAAIAIAEEIPKKAYSQYTAEELAGTTVIDRLKLHNWTLEYVTFGFTLAFVLLYKVGDVYNHKITTKYLKGLNDVFKNNFFQYGTSSDSLYVKDSSENYSSYATGRVNIANVTINFRLKPRHNFFVLVLETIMSYFTENVQAPTDRVDFVITPASNVEYDNFITAIVSKIGMNDHRKFNYFLSLTKTSDSAAIPQSFVFMGEVNEIQEKIATPEIREALVPAAANYLRYIAFTDQASDRPESIKDLIPQRKIIVSTKLVTGDQDLDQLSKILDAVFTTVDKLATKNITFSPEALRRIVKTRENEVSKIQKLLDAEKEQQLADERAKLKQAEKDKFRNLSREEQIKAEKKALEKKQRKTQKRQRVKM